MAERQKKRHGVMFWCCSIAAAVVFYALSLPFALELSDQPWMPRWARDLTLFIYGPLLDLLLKISGETL